MRRVIAVITLLLSCSIALAGNSGARAEDEAAIRAIVTRIEDAWNAGDSRAFAAPFAEDADYVVVNGLKIKGREVIDQGHRRIFDTIYKGSHNTAKVLSIRFLRDDVAVTHVEWNLKFNEGGEMRAKRAMCTMVLTKQGGKWSIAAFHNTPILQDQMSS